MTTCAAPATGPHPAGRGTARRRTCWASPAGSTPSSCTGSGSGLFEVVCPEAADRVEGEALAKEEERARRTASLTMRDTGDGTVAGRFKLPVLHAALLKSAVEALTSPRRLGEGRPDPVTGRKLQSWNMRTLPSGRVRFSRRQ